MLAKIKTSILIFLILLSAALWAAKPAQAMRRESNRPAPIEGEIVEGRSVIVNLASGRVWILEV